MNIPKLSLMTLILIGGIFAWQAEGGIQQLVSVRDTNQPPAAGGNGASSTPVFSEDGRYVLFSSMANNLTASGTSNNSSNPEPFPMVANVFLRDRVTGTTRLVSVDQSGTRGGNGDSVPSQISPDGRYALFESSATNLVAGDNNGVSDVFLRDLVTGTTSLVSVKTNGGPAFGFVGYKGSYNAVMTRDARYVAFTSDGINLTPLDTNGIPDVFVRDMQTGLTTLVSTNAVSSKTGFPVTLSDMPDITPDGRYVAFFSTATNLVAGVTNVGEIYLRDLVAETTYLASTNVHTLATSVFATTNVFSYNHVLSTNGQYVAFKTSAAGSTLGIIFRYDRLTGAIATVSTNASGLVGYYGESVAVDMTPDGRFVAFVGRTNYSVGVNSSVIYVWDAQSGTTTLASPRVSGSTSAAICDAPVFDASGRYVTFLSTDRDLTSTSSDGGRHLYRRDLQLGVTEPVDVNANVMASCAQVSRDGRFIAFESLDSNLVANDSNHESDVFVTDMAAGTNELISAHAAMLANIAPYGYSSFTSSAISVDGRYVAFHSAADNIVPNDVNGFRDVFVRDLVTGATTLVSVDGVGNPAAGPSSDPSMSADGRYVAFTSGANNIVAGDTNKDNDVFVRDLASGLTTLVSVSVNGVNSGNGPSSSPVISADGNTVFFRSQARNLVATVFPSGVENLFLRNLSSGTTYALTTNGVAAAAPSVNGRFIGYALADGTVYVWDTLSSVNVYSNKPSFPPTTSVAVSSDGNRVAYVYSGALRVENLQTKSTVTLGTISSTNRLGLQFSADGRFLSYVTKAANVSADNNGKSDVYLYDFLGQTNILVSRRYDSLATPDADSDSPSLSPDGRFVLYRSSATNILPVDTNGLPDLFLYDRVSGTTTLVSGNDNGTGSSWSINGFFSSDSRRLVFQSWAGGLLEGDFNHQGDVFAVNLAPALLVDSDGDGMDDNWEMAQFGTMDRDGTGDYDGDGATDLFEFQTGTDPKDAHSAFRGILVFGAKPKIVWTVTPGRAYRVQFKTSLDQATWQDLNGSAVVVGDQGSVVDLSPTNSVKFYRIISF